MHKHAQVCEEDVKRQKHLSSSANPEVMQLRSVFESVSFSAFSLNLLFQRSSGNSDLAPDAHHFTPSGLVSQVKWCTFRALWMPASWFLIFLLLSLSLFYLSVSTFSWNSVLPLGQQPSAKTRISVLSAPSNLCCHLDVRSPQLPVPEEGSEG